MQQQPSYAVADMNIGHDERPSWGARIGAFAVIAVVFVIFRLVQWRGPIVVIPLVEATIAAAIATWLADRIYRGIGSTGINAVLLILSVMALNTIWIVAAPYAVRALQAGDVEAALMQLVTWLVSFAMAIIVVGLTATYVPAVLRRRRERLAAAYEVADETALTDTAALQIPSTPGAAPQVQDYSQAPVAPPRRPSEPFWSRHWRGGYPLDTSAWVFGILLTVVRVGFFFLMMIGLYVAFGARGQGLIVSLVILIFFDISVAVWQAVGFCRSAANFIARGGGRIIAMIAAGLVLLVVGVSTVRDVVDVSGAIKTLSLRNRY